MKQDADFVVIGAGIVGLSTAWQLQKAFPDKSVLLTEKESSVAQHQSGHNSGVVHAGVYYTPGSLKARLCRQGLQATYDFCRQHGLRFERCGKLVVASNQAELGRLQALYARCQQNQVSVRLLDQQQLSQLEPDISGVGAIHVPETAVVSYPDICQKLAALFCAAGGRIQTETRVTGIKETASAIRLSTSRGVTQAGFLVSCAGLMADRLVRMQGLKAEFQIVPFRGEYYQLPAEKTRLIKHLIYPVPDPALPFLGVHLTRTIDGGLTVGPNAVVGWKREGYRSWGNFSLQDSLEMLEFSGFWRVAYKHWRSGLAEWRNAWWKRGYLQQLQKYCPGLSLDDLLSSPAGVRAQAVLNDGSLVHDFLFTRSPRSLHVCNAPSPAATSALPIGRYIVQQIQQQTGARAIA